MEVSEEVAAGEPDSFARWTAQFLLSRGGLSGLDHVLALEAVSRTDAGLGHRTTQDNELLAKDHIFGEKRGARTEGRTQRAQDGLENLDKHRGEKATTSGSPENPGKNCGRFDSAPSFCGGQRAERLAANRAMTCSDGSGQQASLLESPISS